VTLFCSLLTMMVREDQSGGWGTTGEDAFQYSRFNKKKTRDKIAIAFPSTLSPPSLSSVPTASYRQVHQGSSCHMHAALHASSCSLSGFQKGSPCLLRHWPARRYVQITCDMYIPGIARLRTEYLSAVSRRRKPGAGTGAGAGITSPVVPVCRVSLIGLVGYSGLSGFSGFGGFWVFRLSNFWRFRGHWTGHSPVRTEQIISPGKEISQLQDTPAQREQHLVTRSKAAGTATYCLDICSRLSLYISFSSFTR
jgi:hypothetical protein